MNSKENVGRRMSDDVIRKKIRKAEKKIIKLCERKSEDKEEN
jgi:hypothetical protein